MVRFRPEAPYADVAHLVERHLAKVEVAGSSPVIRSIKNKDTIGCPYFLFSKPKADKNSPGTVLEFRVESLELRV